MAIYAFFSQGSGQWGKDFVTLGVLKHLPPVTAVLYHFPNPVGALLPHQPKGLGDTEKFHSDITFNLVSTKEEATGSRMYGLSTVWVSPYQARVPTVEEAVRELTALAYSGPSWPYTLVHLNGDTHHAPLPREGHLGILPEGGTHRAGFRRISQLEVCQLLSSGLQVIYSVGLNGCEVPLIAPLPKSLANSTNLTGGKSIYLKVDIPQSITEESDPKALLPGKCPPILMASPVKATPPKLEREVSMNMEVRELLSWVMLDTSGHVSPPSHKLRDPSGPVDTSSQVSASDDAEMAEASLEEIPTATCPTAKTPGPSIGAPPADASYLWEVANKALGGLLATKSSINAHQQKLVWKPGMGLHQNDSVTTESLKEARAICTHATQDAETLCSTTIKEAKAICICSIQETETLCSTTISDVEAWGASQADSLHCTHAKSIQHLEEQAIQEESKS